MEGSAASCGCGAAARQDVFRVKGVGNEGLPLQPHQRAGVHHSGGGGKNSKKNGNSKMLNVNNINLHVFIIEYFLAKVNNIIENFQTKEV